MAANIDIFFEYYYFLLLLYNIYKELITFFLLLLIQFAKIFKFTEFSKAPVASSAKSGAFVFYTETLLRILFSNCQSYKPLT
jgi:hypothetical protein